jgi:hypothetical protein
VKISPRTNTRASSAFADRLPMTATGQTLRRESRALG